MKNKKPYILVPTEVLVVGFRKRCLNQLRTFLYLKLEYGSKIQWDENSRDIVMKDLGVKSRTTILGHIEWLENESLAGRDSNHLFLRGWSRLASVYNLNTKSRVQLNKINFQCFRDFSFAAVAGWVTKKVKSNYLSRERKKGRSMQRLKLLGDPGVATSILCAELNLSAGAVCKYKQRSKHLGYLVIEKCFTELMLPSEYYFSFVKYQPDMYGKTVIRQGQVMCRTSDRIYSQLQYCTRKDHREKK